MSSRSISRKPLTSNISAVNRPGSSLFARNTNSATKKPSYNMSSRPGLAKAQSNAKLHNGKSRAEPNENVEPTEHEPSFVAPRQSVGNNANVAGDTFTQRNLGELLRTTNNSLAQLKVELGRMSEAGNKQGEIDLSQTVRSENLFATQPLNASLAAYQKDVLSELREDNHKLLLADLRLKSAQEALKQTNSALTSDNSALRDRLTSERLVTEMKEQEVTTLAVANAELNARVLRLERELADKSGSDVSHLLEVRRKDELIKTINEQLNTEVETRRRHAVEMELEMARNRKLQNENEKLKQEGRQMLEAIEILKLEIASLKRSNANVLELLRY